MLKYLHIVYFIVPVATQLYQRFLFDISGSVLESVLSVEACKNGVPTLEGLLSHPLFADETVSTVGIKPQLKVSTYSNEIQLTG